MPTPASDLVTLGLRIRHFRSERALTLDQLGEQVGLAASQLSLIENGRREPKLSTLQSLAQALGVPLAELLSGEAPNTRAALEIELTRAQKNPLYGALGLPQVKITKGMPLPAIESLVGLHRELARRASEAIATPEEARRANTCPISRNSPRSGCGLPGTSPAPSPTAR
jgi:transcriptional regulator with XRE-family HTH domain